MAGEEGSRHQHTQLQLQRRGNRAGEAGSRHQHTQLHQQRRGRRAPGITTRTSKGDETELARGLQASAHAAAPATGRSRSWRGGLQASPRVLSDFSIFCLGSAGPGPNQNVDRNESIATHQSKITRPHAPLQRTMDHGPCHISHAEYIGHKQNVRKTTRRNDNGV